MFKGVQGTSTLGKHLKNTKISQFQASIGDRVLNANKDFPTHQIIEAPLASFSRRDFGLKMRIPKKIKTRRIIVNDLDNKYGLPNFETLNGDYFKKLRFKELGVPVTAKFYDSQTEKMLRERSEEGKNASVNKNPLFESSKQYFVPNSIADLLHIRNQPLNSSNFTRHIKPELKSLRRPFLTWLATNYPSSLVSNDLTLLFKKFIETEKPQLLAKSKDYIPSTYSESLSGTAGLGYNLKGRLFQTPNGPQKSRLVPGRLVGRGDNGAKFAVGGFITSLRTRGNDQTYQRLLLQNRTNQDNTFSREVQVPGSITQVTLDLKNRQLNFDSTAITKENNSSKFKPLSSKNRNNSFSQDAGFLDILNLLQSPTTPKSE